MLSLPIWKIHLHGNTAFSTSIIQAYLPWWLFFLQYVLVVVMKQSRYPVFYDKDTSI